MKCRFERSMSCFLSSSKRELIMRVVSKSVIDGAAVYEEEE